MSQQQWAVIIIVVIIIIIIIDIKAEICRFYTGYKLSASLWYLIPFHRFISGDEAHIQKQKHTTRQMLSRGHTVTFTHRHTCLFEPKDPYLRSWFDTRVPTSRI